jgi:preprotein translocase subunit SecD
MYDSRKMDFDPNEIAVSKSNKAPYKFEPFSIEREDGFYEVIKTEGEFYKNVVLAKKAVVSKSEIEEAKADVDEYLHRPIVIVTFNETGTLKFAQATEINIGKPIAIVVNKKVISMPVVHSKIAGGKLHIAGDFTKEEVKEMAERSKSK